MPLSVAFVALALEHPKIAGQLTVSGDTLVELSKFSRALRPANNARV